MVTMELRDRLLVTLTNPQAFNYAADVSGVVSQALHDAGLIGKLLASGRPRATALLAANKARKVEHKAMTGPVLLTSGVDPNTLHPFIGLSVGTTVGRWTVQEADGHARDVLIAAGLADRQTDSRAALIGMGMPDFQATNAVNDLDNYRQKYLGR